LLAQQAARHGFEVVGHDARRAFGVQAEQQVDVVVLAVHLDQLGIPVLAERLYHGFEPRIAHCHFMRRAGGIKSAQTSGSCIDVDVRSGRLDLV
jgi:hypothetical protein